MNKKGISLINVIIALAVLGIVLVPTAKWIYDINRQANITTARVGMMTRAFEEYKYIQQTGYRIAKNKVNKTETKKMDDSQIDIVYKTPLADKSIPVEITVKSLTVPEALPYTFSNQIYATEYNYDEMISKMKSVETKMDNIEYQISHLPK